MAELWAAVRPLGGQERAEADAIAGRVTHEIFIRHRTGVTAAMRFVLGSRVFDIRAALDVDERQRWLRCLAEEAHAVRVGARTLGISNAIGRERFERLKERVTRRLLATAVARAEKAKRLRGDTEREFIADRREE